MHTMASRSASSTTIHSPHPFSAAPAPFFLFFFLLVISSSAAAAAAADHQSDDTTTAWPLLQRPTLSLSLSRSVLEEMKADPFHFIINLPLPQPAEPQYPHPQPRDEQEQEQLLKRGASQSKSQGRAAGWGKCSYTVTIKTSCSSPRVTRDAVSLAFGDAQRNEVYAARLDDPASGTFERCSIDTFRIVGPCGGRTCYLYLLRSGRDGWTPEYVKVFYSPADPRAAVTFFYKVPLPDGVWYGFNLCHGGGAAAAAVPSTLAALPATKAMEQDG